MAIRVPLYPVSLMVSERNCLVVGGGPVAARKVEGLLGCGAHVTVVAPEAVAAMHTLVSACHDGSVLGSLRVELRPYASPEAAHYQLVVTATGIPAVDHAVFADAEAAGVWVNSADDVENCTFLLPAVHRDGTVTVAVSTGGASPALAGWLRNQVAVAIGTDVSVLAGLLDEARSRMKVTGTSTESLNWLEILDEQVVPLVRSGYIDQARAVLRKFVDGA